MKTLIVLMAAVSLLVAAANAVAVVAVLSPWLAVVATAVLFPAAVWASDRAHSWVVSHVR